MKVISIPSVAGSRSLADKVVQKAGALRNEAVLIDSRHLEINTESFVAQLIKRVTEAQPSSVEIIGGGTAWANEVEREAARQQLGITIRGLASA